MMNLKSLTFEQAAEVGTNVAITSTQGHYVVSPKGEVKAIAPDLGFFTTKGESVQVSHNHASLPQGNGFTIIQKVYSSADRRYQNSRD